MDMAEESAAVDDVALRVYADFVMHSANATGLGYVPELTQSFFVTRGSGLHFQFLEVVFTAVLTRVRPCNPLCALERDRFQGRYRESFDGVSESGRWSRADPSA